MARRHQNQEDREKGTLNRRHFVAAAAAVAATRLAPASPKTALEPTSGELGRFSSRTPSRILYVSDPSSIASRYLPDPTTVEDLQEWVDRLSSARVDTFVQEAYTQGWTTYWRVDDLEYDARPQHRRFLPLLEQGIQPLGVLLKHCHKRQMEFLAGIRINDNHGHISVKQGAGAGSSFLVKNTQWQLKDAPPGPYYELSTPLDFSFSQVRDYIFGVASRLVDRFPVDGLELCFRDHRYFPPGQGPERKSLMTELVRRVRQMLDDAGQKRGKRLRLGARVFQTLGECRQLGLDPETWISKGLIDYVSPNDTMHTEPNARYEEFRGLTQKGSCLLYPGILPWTSQRMRSRQGGQPMSLEQQRAAAANMYGAGADGISFYNHFNPQSWAPFYPQQLLQLAEMRDSKALLGGDRHYVFEPGWAGCLGFGADRASTGVVKADRLVLKRIPGSAGSYRFRICENLSEARGATLLFRAFGAKLQDRLEVKINGKPISGKILKRRADEERVDLEATVDPDSSANSGLPPVPKIPGSFLTYWMDLSEPPAEFGDNQLEVALVESTAGASEDIVIDELEVFVKG